MVAKEVRFLYLKEKQQNRGKFVKLGIVGGGQLAKMMLPICLNWDLKTTILDRSGSVAEAFCQDFVAGDFNNEDEVFEAFKECDFVTVDLENISLAGLKRLEVKGVKVAPSCKVLSIIQNKYEQKCFFKENNIPTSPFSFWKNLNEETPVGFLKMAVGGYDGKGVFNYKGNINEVPNDFHSNILWEEKVTIDKEFSVLTFRNSSGEIVAYEPTEMVFDSDLNLINYTLYPSTLSADQIKEAKDLATKISEKIGAEGCLAVEMFLDKNGKILVNELAPRPHNSGHHTIESVEVSQFENHLRGVINMPLGQEQRRNFALTFNCIAIGKGNAEWKGLSELLGVSGVHIHNYGKKEAKPGRKMGHVTIVGSSISAVVQKWKELKDKISIEGV